MAGKHSASKRSKSPKSAPQCARCTETESLRTRYERELAAELETLRLEARTIGGNDRCLITQAAMLEAAGVSAQSLRNYARQGMRVHGTHTRPLYQPGEVLAWMRRARVLRESGHAKSRIEQDEAGTHALVDDAEMVDWDGYVVVPLHWDHPQRAHWLTVAAAGRKPEPTHEDLREHFADDADDFTAFEHDHREA